MHENRGGKETGGDEEGRKEGNGGPDAIDKPLQCELLYSYGAGFFRNRCAIYLHHESIVKPPPDNLRPR